MDAFELGKISATEIVPIIAGLLLGWWFWIKRKKKKEISKRDIEIEKLREALR